MLSASQADVGEVVPLGASDVADAVPCCCGTKVPVPDESLRGRANFRSHSKSGQVSALHMQECSVSTVMGRLILTQNYLVANAQISTHQIMFQLVQRAVPHGGAMDGHRVPNLVH